MTQGRQEHGGGLRSTRELFGLSGATILLASRDDRSFFVRKIAKDPSGSARLKQQATKQRSFHDAKSPLRVPRVLDEGEEAGRYWFDMEYVQGIDGANVLRRAAFSEVAAVADRLCAYLGDAHGKPALLASSNNLFETLYARTCQVEQRTRALGPERLGRILLGLDRVRMHSSLGTTLCHGDLTLENLVVDSGGQLWAIDLLDAPCEHWWLDVAKLHQDLSGGWYLRTQANIALGAVEYVSRRLLGVAEKLTPGYGAAHDVIVATTFARILPYVKSDAEREFVLERVDHFARRCT